MYLDNVKARLEASYIVRRDKIVPCTEEEVQTLEKEIGRPLPAAYREFLLWMGHGSGGLLRGSDFRCGELISLQQAAVELMQEDKYPDPLPEDAFVFLIHQGYQFQFFRTGEGDDPPVYYFLEGGKQPGTITQVSPHFSDFLLLIIEDSARIIDGIASRHPEEVKADPDFARKRADFEA